MSEWSALRYVIRLVELWSRTSFRNLRFGVNLLFNGWRLRVEDWRVADSSGFSFELRLSSLGSLARPSSMSLLYMHNFQKSKLLIIHEAQLFPFSLKNGLLKLLCNSAKWRGRNHLVVELLSPLVVIMDFLQMSWNTRWVHNVALTGSHRANDS